MTQSMVLENMLSPTEPVRRALEAEGLVPVNSTYTRLYGGRTNDLWRVNTETGALVCKLFSATAASPLFPNDSAAEVQILCALTGSGLAPMYRGRVDTVAGTVIVYHYAAGAPWRGDVAEVARTLARLHRHDVAGLTLRHAPSGSAALTRQTETILNACSGTRAKELMTPPNHAEVAPVGHPCLIHGDTVPNNFIQSVDALVLIDWQCPAIGDPCEDLAMFLSPAMQSLYGGRVLAPEDRDAFLDAYGAAPVATRYRSLAPFFHLRMAAHCLWKSQRGESDYAAGMDLELTALEQCRQPDTGTG